MIEDDPNTLIVTSTSSRHLTRVNLVLCVILCIVIVYILSRKHLSVPPGLGQRQQSFSLTFSVFFSAARSQVLPNPHCSSFFYILVN